MLKIFACLVLSQRSLKLFLKYFFFFAVLITLIYFVQLCNMLMRVKDRLLQIWYFGILNVLS